MDDGATAPPSPATKARWWRFVDAAGARMMVAGAVARCHGAARFQSQCCSDGDARNNLRGGVVVCVTGSRRCRC